VAERLRTDRLSGLEREEAERRLLEHGPNAFPEARRRTFLGMFLDQFKDFLVLILVAAAVISFVVGMVSPDESITDAFVILAILVLNAILGVMQEHKANRALDALKKMSVPLCELVRDGRVEEVPSEQVVPGDLVVLREGDFVPADLRLVEAPNLRVDEASLTGESSPVEKRVDAVLAPATPLPDRVNMAYAGTHVVYGRGRGIAIAIGMEREIGRIASMLQEAVHEETPLQRNLAGLGRWLGVGATAICALVFLVGILQGEQALEMFMTAVSLAVAAIPEGLPAVVTVVLALGVYRMSRFNAIIRKLPAVETLGCATCICTDKTGTLTQNRMSVLQAVTAQEILGQGSSTALIAGGSAEEAHRDMTLVGVLCNDAHIERGEGGERRFGDPTELALLDHAEKQGMSVEKIRSDCQRLHETPFDSQRKRMSTLQFVEGRRHILVKGAPGMVLAACGFYQAEGRRRLLLGEAQKQKVLDAMEGMAAQALRVLAFAWKEAEGKETISAEDERALTFVGLMGMMDPPRPEVRNAVREAREAGIRSIMITGDNPLTARAVAEQVGMFEPDDEVITGQELEKVSDDELKARAHSIRVYARVWPEQKMKIVRALQENGEVVAMTGDGVNDAPALKKADIGVAMGITGTEVAKETSDVVLADDNFATIVHAVKEGRVIFDNIRKFVMYLLACNVGEIFVIFIPILFKFHSPLRPVQILLVNLVTDGLVALSLGMDAPEPGLMKRKPRPVRTGIVGGRDLGFILYNAAFITLAALLAYKVGFGMGGPDTAQAQALGRTAAFVTLSMAEIWRAYSFRASLRNVWEINPLTNPYLLAAAASSALIVALTIMVEPLRAVFGNQPLTGHQWLLFIACSLIPFLAVEARTLVCKLLGR
jgi:Ca2+-transporting ATPase